VRNYVGVDLGSTTTKAVMLDAEHNVLGRGITNSRSNYDLAAAIARNEARVSARFTLLDRELEKEDGLGERAQLFRRRLQKQFQKQQYATQLRRLRDGCLEQSGAERVAHIQQPLSRAVGALFETLMADAEREGRSLIKKSKPSSHFFRDRASSAYSRLAEKMANDDISFDDLMSVFDKAILEVENTPVGMTFEEDIRPAVDHAAGDAEPSERDRLRSAIDRVIAVKLVNAGVIGTGYGRQRLPFPKDCIRSEILCHGLGAHRQFPETRTVLDIGGQDTKAIQVDDTGIVTSFQMNDRCAAGCGRYLGYIADEMSLGVHELGPIAMKSTRRVKITSTCTVFAGAELRDRLTNGQRREDILAGLHRAIILRAMALLARSGGIREQFTFTGGVANNPAAVRALRQLVNENYGERTINISPGSIYTGALGAAIFCVRAAEERKAA
jgi:benzoyl-CoA reductase subunit A